MVAQGCNKFPTWVKTPTRGKIHVTTRAADSPATMPTPSALLGVEARDSAASHTQIQITTTTSTPTHIAPTPPPTDCRRQDSAAANHGSAARYTTPILTNPTSFLRRPLLGCSSRRRTTVIYGGQHGNKTLGKTSFHYFATQDPTRRCTEVTKELSEPTLRTPRTPCSSSGSIASRR